MNLPTNKSLLAISISMALSLPLLTACGGSDNDNNQGSSTNNIEQDQGIDANAVTAYANTAKFTPETVVKWQPLPVVPSEVGRSDETVLDMSVQNGKVVAFTKWHNSIIRFDKNDKNATTEPEKFATLVTSQEHVLSSDDDIVSGATEHTLTEVQYSPDGKTLYALVNVDLKETPVPDASDDSYGLFKVALNDDGNLPTQQINGKTTTHRGDHVKRVGNTSITDFLLLPNNAVLAMDKKNNAVGYYDENFVLQESNSFGIGTDKTLKDWVADDQAVYILIEDTKNKSAIIEKHLLTNPSAAKSTITVDNSVASLTKAGKNLVLIGKNSLQLTDSNIKKLAEVNIPNGIMTDDVSVSPSGKRIAVKNKSGDIYLVNIGKEKMSKAIKVPLNDIIVGKFTLADDNTLIYNSRTGEFSKIDLKQKMVTLNDAQTVQASLDNISIKDINSGYPADAVRSDLSLPIKDTSLPITYTWISSNPSVISNDGKVTQPTNGQPAQVTLTVQGHGTNNATESKDFVVTVLPVVADNTSGQETDLSKELPKKRLNYNYGQYSSNTANADGSLFAFFANDLLILQKQADNSVKAVLDTDNHLIKINAPNSGLDDDATIKTVLWQDNNTLWVLLGDAHKGALVKQTFTNPNDINSLQEEANSPWEVVKTYNTPVIAGFINNKKTLITVVTEQSLGEYMVENYNVTSNKVTSSYSTKMNLSQNYVTVNDTGDIIFVTTRDRAINGGVFYRLVKGQVDSDFVVDEPYHSGVVTQNGDFIGGGRAGGLLFIKNATNLDKKLTKADAKKRSFARKNQRIYSMSVQGDQLFVSYRNVGAAIVDISNFEQPVETQFLPFSEIALVKGEKKEVKKNYLVVPSSDGKTVLQAGDKNGKFKVTTLLQ